MEACFLYGRKLEKECLTSINQRDGRRSENRSCAGINIYVRTVNDMASVWMLRRYIISNMWMNIRSWHLSRAI